MRGSSEIATVEQVVCFLQSFLAYIYFLLWQINYHPISIIKQVAAFQFGFSGNMHTRIMHVIGLLAPLSQQMSVCIRACIYACVPCRVRRRKYASQVTPRTYTMNMHIHNEYVHTESPHVYRHGKRADWHERVCICGRDCTDGRAAERVANAWVYAAHPHGRCYFRYGRVCCMCMGACHNNNIAHTHK